MLERFLNLLGYSRRGLLASPSAELLSFFGAQPTAAGMSVNSETIFNSPTASAAIRTISDSIGTMPVHLYKRGPDGTKERVVDHPAARLMADNWNSWTSSAEGRMAVQVDALTSEKGYGVALVLRAGGKPTELHQLDPRAVSVLYDTETFEPVLKVNQSAGEARTLRFQDVVFVHVPGWCVHRQLSLLHSAREAVALDLVMAQRQGRMFGNAPQPGARLKLPATASLERAKQLKAEFEEIHAGAKNTGKLMTLHGGIDYEPPEPFNAVDAQFLELRRFVIAEISRVYRVPPPYLSDLERSVWRNLEQLQIQLIQGLLAWCEIWQAALSRSLLTLEEQKNYYFEFVVEELLKADTATRFAAYRVACGSSFMTSNEVRARENLSKSDDPDADKLIRQAGQEPAGSSREEDDDDEDDEPNLRAVK